MPAPKKKPPAAKTPKPTATKKAKPPEAGGPVEAHKHTGVSRSNIPTRENTPLVADDEAAPKAILYPRDASLDPQLVWKGKDALDAKPLEVPSVPIYIQEKIHPQFLIEDLRRRSREGQPSDNLFADFNGLTSDQARTEFYQHGQHWTNRLILGDSLLVMTSLAEKERLRGQVQCIYFDPPYGIKFGSNWQVSTRKRDVRDSKAEDLTRQPEQIRAFRDTWEQGIHSYLTVLRDRLTVARELLTESGSCFVQIGDENVHLVRNVMDEVFGAENCISTIQFAKTSSASSELLPGVADYILWYAKFKGHVKYHPLYAAKVPGEVGASKYDGVEEATGNRRLLTSGERVGINALPKGSRVFTVDQLTSQRPPGSDPFTFQGKTYVPVTGYWKTSVEGLNRLALSNRVVVAGNRVRYVRYLDDFPVFSLNNIWTDVGSVQSRTDPKVYVVQTSATVIERCLLMTTDPGDLVLDPTCGSGTTAYVAEQWGRRWITIDTSRVAVALARTRLMAAKFPYYLLADSAAGRKKQRELGIEHRSSEPRVGSDPQFPKPGVDEEISADAKKPSLKAGFVYKTVPHVTLKSIANNPDIREGMTRDQIDAAIRKHAETETLFDQPYEDKGIVRVCGPFTVESLSPHRMLPDAPGADGPSPAAVEAGKQKADFVTVILDNLRKAGVQNTKKGEKLKFDHLDPYPGKALIAEGEYTNAEGKPKRVGVCLGPEFGTVGPELIHEAAKEAVRSLKLDFDLVLVCGFAFDPHVWEEGKDVERQIGKMKVLLVRMNPDLSMGDELLKKTGAGNLFMVFGEPDIAFQKDKGKMTVTVKGVDIFDPNTGEIRSSGPDEIATWFIDTDYDGKSFFVLGAQEPYEKLKKAMKAEIDEGEWSKLYSATSIPFDPPKTGKIAVKVVNHYGDEVLKVYTVKPMEMGDEVEEGWEDGD
jgi:adenine-specific DNA-methyltransferase